MLQTASMKVNTMDETPPILLQSKDHEELLNVIDQLRSQGLRRYVNLPQLIVCGDQSSGKSSVLEAISGVRFPTKDNLCTRFATELVLRRGPTENVKIEIIPGAGKSNEQKHNLSAFKAPSTDITAIPEMIDAAKEVMGLGSDTDAFSDDVLRIEITGPHQSHLSLVDLPGLIQSQNRQQSKKDVETVLGLTTSYMQNRRSIILAVVTAKNDYANQAVTKHARKYDPKGTRTLGIITKPDALDAGSETEEGFISLAKNEDVAFRLGWHVLKNRDYGMRDCSAEERDVSEKEFFSKGVWLSLPWSILGIDSLKPRLSLVLRDQIISELPNLTGDIEEGIKDCKSNLAKLGERRENSHEQRLYLMRISQKLTSILQAAVDGVYSHTFFGYGNTKDGYSKRLRAVVSNTLAEFTTEMCVHGHKQNIVERFIKSLSESEKTSQKQITRSDFIDDVCSLMKRSKGRELPGTFNPLIIGDLFYMQASPWKRIVERYSDKIIEAAKVLLKLALESCSDEKTRKGLLMNIVGPAVEGFSLQLRDKINEIMLPHQGGHPITYNHYFTENIQKSRQKHQEVDYARRVNSFFGLEPKTSNILHDAEFYTGDLIAALTQRTEQDMDRYAASEATYCMEAYYKVAMKMLVDNFSVVAIERCVIEKIPTIFTPDIVLSLDDKTVNEIASETKESATTRTQNLMKLEKLESGLQTLNRLAHHRVAEATEVNSVPAKRNLESLSEQRVAVKGAEKRKFPY